MTVHGSCFPYRLVLAEGTPSCARQLILRPAGSRNSAAATELGIVATRVRHALRRWIGEDSRISVCRRAHSHGGVIVLLVRCRRHRVACSNSIVTFERPRSWGNFGGRKEIFNCESLKNQALTRQVEFPPPLLSNRVCNLIASALWGIKPYTIGVNSEIGFRKS